MAKRTDVEIEEIVNKMILQDADGKSAGYIIEYVMQHEDVVRRTAERYWARAQSKIIAELNTNYKDKLAFYINKAEAELSNLAENSTDDLDGLKFKKECVIDLVRLFRDGPGELNVTKQTTVQTAEKDTVISG